MCTPFCGNKSFNCLSFSSFLTSKLHSLQVNAAHEAEEIHMDVALPDTNSDNTVHQPAEYMDISDIHSFELARDDIKFARLLGSGNFGEVFKATVGSDTVAVKSLKGETFTPSTFECTAVLVDTHAQ